MTTDCPKPQAAQPRAWSTGLQLLAVLVCWQIGTAAQAQSGFGQPVNQQTVSPYLNLFRNNDQNNSVLNYYGLVRPQNQLLQQNRQLTQGLVNLQQQSRQIRSAGQPRGVPRFSQIGITGHPTAFMTFRTGAAGGVGPGSGGFGGGGFGAGLGGGFSSSVGGGIGTSIGGVPSFSATPGVPGSFTPGLGGFGLNTVTGHPAVFGAGGGSRNGASLNGGF